MESHPERPFQLIRALLEEEVPVRLRQAAEALFEMLAAEAGLDEQSHREPRRLSAGTAIGPYWAAMCLQDILRTQRFMRGVFQAVKDTREKYPDEQIHVLYIGAGPFATLVLPVMARYSAKEIAVTLLDIHEEALAMAEKNLDALGLQDRVRAFIQADATTFQMTDLGKVHVVVLETMQHALEREPQVAISLNIAPQLSPDTVWIPQYIRIEAALMDMQKDEDRQFGQLPEGETSHRVLGKVLDLNMRSAVEMAARFAGNGKPMEECRLDIPATLANAYPWLALFTEIHIYGSCFLRAWDSALCAPRLLAKLTDMTPLPPSVRLTYRMGATPGFDHSFR